MNLQAYTPQNVATVSPYRIQELMDSFINDQDVKENSRSLYRRTLKQFFKWIDAKGYQLAIIARPHIIEYKEALLASGMSSLTVGSYISSVRRFYEWAEAKKFYNNVAKGIRAPKRIQQFKKQPLQPKQASELLSFYQALGSRDYAIVNLLLRTGLRTIEAVNANVADITYKGSQRVLQVKGKGRDEKDNFVVLTDKAYAPIEEYLVSRGRLSGSDPLFTSTSNNSRGERLTTRTVSYIAKEGLKAIGLNERSFTAHSLRHTGATNILRATGDLEQTRLFCRHSNPATTLIYTATLDEERRLQNSGEALLDSLY